MSASGLIIAAGSVVAAITAFGASVGDVNGVAAAIALVAGGLAVERLN